MCRVQPHRRINGCPSTFDLICAQTVDFYGPGVALTHGTWHTSRRLLSVPTPHCHRLDKLVVETSTAQTSNFRAAGWLVELPSVLMRFRRALS